jgi:two-component system, cell cycle response regulator
MAQNNQQPESIVEHEPRPISVAILGFEVVDEESFNRFFQVARPYQRKYVSAGPTDMVGGDILMVNYDNPLALAERDSILTTRPNVQVVAVSRGPLADPPVHHIRGMLFAARVLTTLDKVIVESVSEVISGKPEEAVEMQPDAEKVAPQVVEQLAPQVQVAPMVTDASETATILTPSPGTPEAATASAPEGYRALVVDDSIAIQKSLEINLATLSQISMIDFADSGESALEKAEAVQYDLIFLDVMMPGIDGYETCTRLRKKPEYKKTPIIMVSGKTSPLDEVKGVMAGCTTYLTKPVQQEAFQKLSNRVLVWLEKQKKP